MRLTRRGAGALIAGAASGLAAARAEDNAGAAAADARALIDLIFDNYAYPERLTGFSETRLRALRADAAQVVGADDLVRFGERALTAIFDHHAILGSSLADSYGLVPSYADLWVVADASGGYGIDDVRAGSAAERAGVRPGDMLVGVGRQGVDAAIAELVGAPAAELDKEQRAYCARVLATGRRDRPRSLRIARGGRARTLTLPNLYVAAPPRGEGPISTRRIGQHVSYVRFNNSLGDSETIAAFDAAVADAGGAVGMIVDLRDTPSGGDSSVARAVLGWFVDRPVFYQHHELTAEARETGVRRSWAEEVSPRPGGPFAGRVAVLVGRWTGSMGEGMAVGFDAIGAPVFGSRMAGLRGAVYDFPLPNSGLVLKLPAERLTHVNGTPRENFAPPMLLAHADAPENGRDLALARALTAMAPDG